jgi:enoyl-CoA hydratase/carnithine racemase
VVTRSPDHRVVTVEMNRPEALNAMNTAMGRDMVACVEALRGDREARAVVLCGAGERVSCVGGGLKERQGMLEAHNNTIATEDRLEGVRAFNEKRPPVFRGR